jgi:hypothetical protein
MISRQLAHGLFSNPDLPAIPHKNGCETGLFRVGHGSKSIFWYWEIDSVGRTYRHFWSADFEKGMETFLAEDWESWGVDDSEVDTDHEVDEDEKSETDG